MGRRGRAAAAASASRPDWFSRLLDEAARERDQRQPAEINREPIVIVVDGLDEAEPDPAGGRGLPLGLPENLPDGVYVVAGRVQPVRR